MKFILVFEIETDAPIQKFAAFATQATEAVRTIFRPIGRLRLDRVARAYGSGEREKARV